METSINVNLALVPEVVALLEVAFHGVRGPTLWSFSTRFSAATEDEDINKSDWKACPKCGASLAALPVRQSIGQMKEDGLTSI